MATTNPNAPPSANPADLDTLQGVFNTILRKFLQGVDDMLPARVISYDRTANRVTVQPVIAMLTTAGAQVARAQIASIPVLLIGGGGMALSFNLKPGDFGWVKANDRDISIFLQSYGPSQPNTMRYHSFEDALFIPDAMHNMTIEGEDDENAVLQTLDGKYRVAIWSDRVKITGDDSDVTIKSGEIDINSPAGVVNVNAPQINLNGNVTSGGGAGTDTFTIAATGAVNIEAPTVTIQGREFLAHEHNGVTPGGGNSGGVV